MAYTVTPEDTRPIDLFPASVAQEVVQNVATILATPRYTVPMHRLLGLSMNYVDRPLPAAEALLAAELYEQLEDNEPRVRVVDITFEKDELLGKLTPRVEVEVVDEDE